MDVKFNDTDGNVVKATFHPLNNHIIVILQEKGPLQLVDIVETDNHVQIFPINEGCLFSSFCFGPKIDWMSLSVILLEKQGGIFALCPVLPKGSKVSKQIVEDMHQWLDEKGDLNSGQNQNNQSKNYLYVGKKYLEDAFENNHGNDEYLFAGDSINDLYSPTRIFSQKPRLQGPFEINCLPAHRKKFLSSSRYKVKKENSNEQVVATDICTPYNSSNSNSCPVICVSYSTGELDYLIFGDNDITDSIPSIGPAWLSDESSKKDIVSPKAKLIFVETVSIYDKSESNSIKIPDGNWSIIPDPIHPHYVHMINSSASLSYLISSDLLCKSFDSIDNNNGDDSYDKLVPSVCTPVFSTLHRDVSLCGVIIKYDPMIGHIAMFRLSNGIFAVVNLSVHSRLCEYQNLLVNFKVENNQNLLETEYQEYLKIKVKAKEKSDKLLKKIEAGLLTSTMLIGQKKVLTEGRSEYEKQDLLQRTTEHLEKEVIIPLEDLNKRLDIKVEGINEFISIQENSVKEIQTKIQNLSDEQEKLKEKIGIIKNRYNDQKMRMEELLSMILILKHPISRGERVYYNQLTAWSQLTHRMSGTIDNLRRHAKAIKLQSLSEFNSSSNIISSPIATRHLSTLYGSPSLTGISPIRATPGSSQMFVSPQKLPPTRSSMSSKSSQKGGSLLNASPSKSINTPIKSSGPSNNYDIAYKSPHINKNSGEMRGNYSNISNINISTPSFDISSSAMKIQGETTLGKNVNTPSTPNYKLNRSQTHQTSREPVLSASEIEACKKLLLEQDEVMKLMMEEVSKLEEKLNDHKKKEKNLKYHNNQNNY